METDTTHSTQAVDLPVADITAGELQVRVTGLTDAHVRALSETLDELPPVTVVNEDGSWLLVDGHHTLAAAQNSGSKTVRTRVVPAPADGDLIGLAFDCNATHGLALTLADRRAFARHLLGRDPQSSNMEVSRRAGLSPSTVAAIRERLESEHDLPASDRQVRRGQASYTYPGNPRQPGQLPEEALTTTLVDGMSAVWSSRQRRTQRRLARYLDRLIVALTDRQTLEGWGDPQTVATACLDALGQDRAAEFADELRDAATDLLAVCTALGAQSSEEGS